jgi:hypothetical protein
MGQAGDDAEDCGCSVKESVFLNHHLGSFYDGGDGVTFLEFEFVSTTARNDALNEIVSNSNCHVGHDITQLDFFDCSTQFVSG